MVPQVSFAGGDSFAPRFELALIDLVHKPLDEFTAKETAKTTGTRTARAGTSGL
ncbi:MAG: hypothetical protein NVS3B26_02190 [Mycobacteriales bacterium]